MVLDRGRRPIRILSVRISRYLRTHVDIRVSIQGSIRISRAIPDLRWSFLKSSRSDCLRALLLRKRNGRHVQVIEVVPKRIFILSILILRLARESLLEHLEPFLQWWLIPLRLLIRQARLLLWLEIRVGAAQVLEVVDACDRHLATVEDVVCVALIYI